MALSLRSLSRSLPGVVLGLCALTAPAAVAQTSPVEPYFATTSRADVPLKSGDMDGYYPVAQLPQGQVLRVDAEGAGWARVEYPPGLTVYVAAADVREEAPGVVTLTKVSALKSRNASAGFGQSWQRAVPRGAELPIGTRLHVVEPINGPDGKAIGYVIEPPKEVRGFIKVDSLRAATQPEIDAYLAAHPATRPERAAPDEPKTDGPAPTKPEPVTPEPTKPEPTRPEVGQPKPGEQTPISPEAPDAAGKPSETDTSLLQPAQPSGETPTSGDQSTPDQPEVTEIRQGDAVAPSPEEREIGTLEHLASMYADVQAQPSDTAELDELAAEFRRAIAAQGDDASGQRIRTALEQRLMAVNMRIELRDKGRELRARREAIDASTQAVTGKVRELERTRGYQFVGRLVRSSVYDGVRLPLMYRMVSVNERVPRTIGYIKPGDESLDVAGKLGEIIGVLGTSTYDPALKLRLVSPTRVDVLQAEGLAIPEAAPIGDAAGG
ncbi:MAG: hypothetical protein IPJ41_04890 [Phycisphaerales bacterium]|nr:hypothetical protein [Phycisphaerales bacterium]